MRASDCHSRKTVLLVDEHPVVRRGMRGLIDTGTEFDVVGEAGNRDHAVQLAVAIEPDIVVLDPSMPNLGGIEIVIELRQRLPNVEFVIFTMQGTEPLLAAATEAGVRAGVCKSESEHLVPALRAVACRHRYFSPNAAEALGYQRSNRVLDDRPLTDREKQVVKLIAEGYSNADIARLLNISLKTTSTHRETAMRKTGKNSMVGLTQYAVRHGLVAL